MKANDFIFSPKYRFQRHVFYWLCYILVWGNLPDVAREHLKVILPELGIQPES
jgi:hypothetical protein